TAGEHEREEEATGVAHMRIRRKRHAASRTKSIATLAVASSVAGSPLWRRDLSLKKLSQLSQLQLGVVESDVIARHQALACLALTNCAARCPVPPTAAPAVSPKPAAVLEYVGGTALQAKDPKALSDWY